MNSYLSSVNQKHLFSTLLVDQARASEQRHLTQALLQGAVDHLHQAVAFYFCEVAETYQCPKAAQADSPEALSALLADMGKTPAEVSEILGLGRDPDSWFSAVENAYRALHSLPPSVAARSGEELISTVALTEARDWSFLEVGQVQAWLTAFADMVERHRESMIEY